jgi:tRNA dimethylallyltransferase
LLRAGRYPHNLFIPDNPLVTGNKIILHPKIILIGGPTASGKSKLAMDVAEAVGGAIVNADSMQVYRELPTLTARPSAADEAHLPHYLYGVLAADEPCSVALWAGMAQRAISEIWANQLIPVVVGGTGLYFKALLEGLAPVPDIPPEIRGRVRQMLADEGPEYLHARLQKLDPEMAARLNPGDSQRLSRATEVLEATGRSLKDWQNEQPQGGLNESMQAKNIVKAVLLPPRDILYARCNERLRQMVEEGPALEELKSFLEHEPSPDLPLMKALGVPHLAGYLHGEEPLEAALLKAQAATRQYAKRQLTWFRNQFSDWRMLDAQYSESKNENFLSFITNL